MFDSDGPLHIEYGAGSSYKAGLHGAYHLLGTESGSALSGTPEHGRNTSGTRGEHGQNTAGTRPEHRRRRNKQDMTNKIYKPRKPMNDIN